MENLINLHNVDCMEFMAKVPNKYYDLAIVDPPYGIGISDNPVRQMHTKKKWDISVPKTMYFTELFRVSKEQIIWGGNYFDLPASQGFLIWDKKQPEDFSLAMCEMAWMSFQKPAKIWTRSVLKDKGKIHPTQKPVKLYEWLLLNYAKPNDKIIDTHGGSMSIALALHNMNTKEGMNLSLDVCELDKEYFNMALERFKKHQAQLTIFDVH